MTVHDWQQALSRVNLNQIVTFLVVSEERSFRAAAQRMHISQSAVSMQVQHLERSLGVPLFHRTTRSVAMTREGAVLAGVARRVTADLVETTIALREQAELQRGIVTVAATPAFASMLLPRLMFRYAELHPNVEVRLLDLDSQGVLQALHQGEADLAVLARTPDMEAFEFSHLFQDEFVILIPADSTMFNGRTVVRPDEAAREQMVLSPKGAQTRALVEQIFSTLNCQLNVRQECQRPETLLALVENGFGITILPRTVLLNINLSRLRVVQLQPKPIRAVGIVTMRNRSLSPAARSFRDFLRSTRLASREDKPLALAD